MTSAAVSSGRTYWVAVLGTSTNILFRDRSKGPWLSENSSQTCLASLPSTWKRGPQFNTCPISACVNGYLTGAAAPPPPTAPWNMTPSAISGATIHGQALTTSSGSRSDSPTGRSYQWRQCDSSGNTISGGTASSYTLTSSGVGHTMRAIVTATTSGGSTPAASGQTNSVASPAPAAPSNTAMPTISGTTAQGQYVSTSSGSWSGSSTGYSYQWCQCDSSGNKCANMSSATVDGHTLASGDVGHTMRVVVTATNAGVG